MRHRLLLPALASILLLASFLRGGPVLAVDAGPPGASSCTGCHAAKRIPDSVIPRIAGRKASDIVQFMREYRSGAWPSSVMGRIAKGFDDQQIDAIAAWFAAQPE
jgi:cytochrome subunit of sulfide dehydrogenase